MQAQKVGTLIRDEVRASANGSSAYLMQKLRVEARGSDVIIDWQLDAPQMNALMEMLDAFIPMMIGGMNIGVSSPDADGSDIEGGLEGDAGEETDGSDDISLEEMADQAAVRRRLDEHKAELVACSKTATKADPNLDAFVVIFVEVGVDGKVSHTFVEGPVPGSLHDCLEGVVQKIAFDPPKSGKPVETTYPFVVNAQTR
jgi:hypothetical protein